MNNEDKTKLVKQILPNEKLNESTNLPLLYVIKHHAKHYLP